KRISIVELTFPGHLVREYHAYGPFYRDAQCPRDYTIQVWDDSAWRDVHTQTNNYQRQRRHAIDAVTTAKLRIVVTATNGDPAAAIYEVRCYAGRHG
ncbi:MAG: FAD-dependent oxidoreductase, partial [Opitutaceae bacterium]